MKYSIYLSLNVVLISILIAGGCSDINSGDNEPEIRIEHLEDETEIYTDEESYQIIIEDLRKHPEIIDQINKNREHPTTVENLIKEYQHEIEELRKMKQSKEYQRKIEKLKKKRQKNNNTDTIDNPPANSYYYSACYGFSRISGYDTGKIKRKIVFTVTTRCDFYASGIRHILNYQIYQDGRTIGGGKFTEYDFGFKRSLITKNYVSIYSPDEVHATLSSRHITTYGNTEHSYASSYL